MLMKKIILIFLRSDYKQAIFPNTDRLLSMLRQTAKII